MTLYEHILRLERKNKDIQKKICCLIDASEGLIEFQDDGVQLAPVGSVNTIDFVGTGVLATYGAGKVTVSIDALVGGRFGVSGEDALQTQPDRIFFMGGSVTDRAFIIHSDTAGYNGLTFGMYDSLSSGGDIDTYFQWNNTLVYGGYGYMDLVAGAGATQGINKWELYVGNTADNIYSFFTGINDENIVLQAVNEITGTDKGFLTDSTMARVYFDDATGFSRLDATSGTISLLQTDGVTTTTISMIPTKIQFTAPVGKYQFDSVPVYVDNAAALGGGLTAGQIYRDGDNLKIVH